MDDGQMGTDEETDRQADGQTNRHIYTDGQKSRQMDSEGQKNRHM